MAGDFSVIVDPYLWKIFKNDDDDKNLARKTLQLYVLRSSRNGMLKFLDVSKGTIHFVKLENTR